MMVPRSYLFQGPPAPRTTSPTPERKQRKNMGSATVRAIPTPKLLPKTQEPKKPALKEQTSQPVTIPSQPMLIQHHSGTRRPSLSPHTQTVMSRGQHGGRRSRRTTDTHDPNALPPAVAALLAVTAIPPPRGLQRRRSQQSNRRVTIDELIQEWRQEGSPSSSEPFRSRLDILLEPAGDEDDESLADIEDEREGEFLSSRSVSSDSIAESVASTTPSLDAANSTMSTLSSVPSTPSFRSRRVSAMRAEKQVVSPPTEQCVDDHPLRPSSADSDDTVIPIFTPRTTSTLRKKSSFKSNLTSSFNALKSAAKSFSNFTAPSIPSDDMLTRSLFSSHFTNEMRPKDIDGVPDPALRRYLNPTQGVQPPPLSLDDFSAQVSQALAQPAFRDDEPTPMIQMQTYSRSRRRQKGGKNGASVDRGEAAVLGQTLPAVRQREPRENSDFLRVVVLELNMRRTGKLDMKSPGRARVWLPARRNGEVEVESKTRVPIRWQGVTAEEL